MDLGKSCALSTIHVRQQSSAPWLDQQIFGRNERPRASAESSDSSVGPEQTSADFWDSFPHACFWQLVCLSWVNVTAGGETGGPLLARIPLCVSHYYFSVPGMRASPSLTREIGFIAAQPARRPARQSEVRTSALSRGSADTLADPLGGRALLPLARVRGWRLISAHSSFA